MSKQTMFSLGLEALALKDLLETPSVDNITGEVLDDQETLNALFDELSKSTNSKLDSAIYIVREFEATTEALKKEIARLQARKKASENNAIRLKQRIFELVNLQDDKKVKTEFNTFSIKKTKSVNIISAENIARKYFKIEKKPILSELKKAIEGGEFIEGVEIQEKYSLGVR